MKTEFLVVCVVASLFLLLNGCSRPPSPKEIVRESSPAEKPLWTCSMCPQIRQDHSGECPMCGMDLVPLRSMTTSPIGEVEQSHETMIRLDPAQRTLANIRTSPVEERLVKRKVDLFGEISYVTDKQVDFTWYYGGRVQKNLVGYNTTEIKQGTPIMEVYSDEAIADQRDILEMLMEVRKQTSTGQKILDAKYGVSTILDAR